MSAGGLVWPSYAAVEADGYGVTDDNDVDRTPFDDGLIRQERRYASALTALSITALLASDGGLSRASAPGPAGAPTAGLPGPRRKAAACTRSACAAAPAASNTPRASAATAGAHGKRPS